MITISKIPCQPTTLSSNPTSELQFSEAVVKFNLGFARHRRGPHRLWLVDESGKMELFRSLSKGCFKGQSSKERNIEVESVNGGEDVFDAEARVKPDHLIIMVNGIIGRKQKMSQDTPKIRDLLPEALLEQLDDKNVLGYGRRRWCDYCGGEDLGRNGLRYRHQ